MVILAGACSVLWRRRAVGGDLSVWNGEEDESGTRFAFSAFAFAVLIVVLRDALLLAIDAVPSALALIDFAGGSSWVTCGRSRFWDPSGPFLVCGILRKSLGALK